MNKPRVLYHASPNKNIKVFQPRNESIRDPKEGLVVFGTPDKAFASMFLVESDDTWTQKSRFSNVYITIINSKRKYQKMDKGGAIYTLSSNSFECDLKKGIGKKEWFSKVPIKPISKEVYSSGLEAMLDNEVQVYFCDKMSFQKIINSKDHGHSILKNLTSENKKQGRSIKSI